MADTPNERAEQPEESSSGQTTADQATSPEEPTVTKPVTAKKTSTKKRTATKKKVAKKKIVAKKAGKKKAPKKKAASSEAPSPSAPTPRPPAPRPPAAVDSRPVWDEEREPSLVSWLVKVGPVILLLLLIWVLDDERPEAASDEADTPVPQSTAPATTGSAAKSPASATSGAAVVTSTATTDPATGAITLPPAFDPWSSTGLFEAPVLPDGTGTDPGAFYWGPSALSELPPAPQPAE